MDNELNVRLQHAVEHDETIEGVTTQCPSNSSVPKNGEIIFNSDRNNFKVGDGVTTYGNLILYNSSIDAHGSVYTVIPSTAQSLSTIIKNVLTSAPNFNFPIDNHIVIYDYNGVVIPDESQSSEYYSMYKYFYINGDTPICTETTNTIYKALSTFVHKTLKVTFCGRIQYSSDENMYDLYTGIKAAPAFPFTTNHYVLAKKFAYIEGEYPTTGDTFTNFIVPMESNSYLYFYDNIEFTCLDNNNYTYLFKG